MNRYEQIISTCGFSEEMERYLIGCKHNDYEMIEIILGAPLPLTEKRKLLELLNTPDSEGFIRTLSQVVKGRHAEMPEGSYTTKLFIKGVKTIAKKVGEETTEMIIEAVDGKRDRFIYEASDMIYHFLVLLEQMGVSKEELEKELMLRHR